MATQKIKQRLVTTASTTGDFNSDAAGTLDAAATVVMSQVKPGSLCAEATVDAETNTLTIAVAWQVSKDNSTWLRLGATANNAAEVVLATGTAGADAAVTRVIPAPDAVYSFPYARACALSGVTTGGASDVWDIKYHYLRA